MNWLEITFTRISIKKTSYTNIMVTMLCLYLLIGAVSGSSIVKPPTDTIGTIGGTATFVCEVDYGEHIPTMTWRFNNKIIYSYLDYQVDYPLGTNKYVVSNNHTTFTLEVKNLNYTDGGDYVCEVIGQKKSAALIVLGSPVITQETTSLMEGTTAKFTCEARYGGPSTESSLDIYPQIQLVLDDVIYKAQSQFRNRVFFQKVYEILVDDSMDTKALKCEIGTAKSKHLTSSTVLNVHYSVRNISYSPKEDKYEFGSNITCSARGNPHPLFEWKNRANPEIIIKGQLLNIADDMEGKISWTCTARNSVGGRMYEDEVTVISEAGPNADGNNSQDVNLWLVLGPIAVGCLAAVILCFAATGFKLFKTGNYTLKVRNPLDKGHKPQAGMMIKDEENVPDSEVGGSTDLQSNSINEATDDQLRTTLNPKSANQVDKDGEPKESSSVIRMDTHASEDGNSTKILVVIHDMTKESNQEDLLGTACNSQDEDHSKPNKDHLKRPRYVSQMSGYSSASNSSLNNVNKEKLWKEIDDIRTADDLTEKRKGTISNLLNEFYAEPWLLKLMVNKANFLVESEYYVDIIKEMVDMTKENCNTSNEKLLNIILSHMNQSMELFKRHQVNFLRIIQVLLSVEDGEITRRKLFWLLFKNAMHQELEWSKELVEVLKEILKDHPNLAWKPKDEERSLGKQTVLYTVFQNMPIILSEHESTAGELKTLLLNENYLNQRGEDKGTVLHALVNADWEKLSPTSTSPDWDPYKIFIDQTVKAMANLCDSIDKKGRTPIHCFFRKTIQCNAEKFPKEIFKILLSDSNIKIRDHKGNTVLHLVSEAFNKCQNSRRELMDIMPSLISKENVNTQNSTKDTPYTWILSGKLQIEDQLSEQYVYFSKMEQKFIDNNADAMLAKAGAAYVNK